MIYELHFVHKMKAIVRQRDRSIYDIRLYYTSKDMLLLQILKTPNITGPPPGPHPTVDTYIR